MGSTCDHCANSTHVRAVHRHRDYGLDVRPLPTNTEDLMYDGRPIQDVIKSDLVTLSGADRLKKVSDMNSEHLTKHGHLSVYNLQCEPSCLLFIIWHPPNDTIKKAFLVSSQDVLPGRVSLEDVITHVVKANVDVIVQALREMQKIVLCKLPEEALADIMESIDIARTYFASELIPTCIRRVRLAALGETLTPEDQEVSDTVDAHWRQMGTEYDTILQKLDDQDKKAALSEHQKNLQMAYHAVVQLLQTSRDLFGDLWTAEEKK